MGRPACQFRLAAIASGAPEYDGPRPCKACGGVRRYTSNGVCVRCAREHGNKVTAERRAKRATLPTNPKTQSKINRAAAIAAGKKQYDGRPCKKGHGTLRNVNGGCVECGKESSKVHSKAKRAARNATNPSPLTLARRARKVALAKGDGTYDGQPCKVCNTTLKYIGTSSCVKCGNARCRDYSKRKRPQIVARMKKWKAKPGVALRLSVKRRIYREENHEQEKANSKAWGKANKHRKAEAESRRRILILRATPPNLSPEDHAEILAIFAEGTRLGKAVDHIFPVAGCKGHNCHVHGLHVPWNLQILDKPTNSSKRDKCDSCFAKWARIVSTAKARYKVIMQRIARLRRDKHTNHPDFAQLKKELETMWADTCNDNVNAPSNIDRRNNAA